MLDPSARQHGLARGKTTCATHARIRSNPTTAHGLTGRIAHRRKETNVMNDVSPSMNTVNHDAPPGVRIHGRVGQTMLGRSGHSVAG
eukprot:4189940-Pyramimonas_sp.AAC.1